MKQLLLLLLSSLIFTSNAFAQAVHIQATPGGVYYVPDNVKNLKLSVIGKGSKEKPFLITSKSNRSVLTGSSFIKIDNSSENIIIENLVFENNIIDYKASTSLIEIGTSKKSKARNIKIVNTHFDFTAKFKDKQKQTQFHWINIFGQEVIVQDCSFKGKKNRLPIIHVNSNFDGVRIQNNVFRDVPPRVGEALEAIRIGLVDGISNVVVTGNHFLNYNGDSETISIKADSAQVSNNKFDNCRSGIVIRYANSCRIIGNTFNNTIIPLRIAGKNHSIIGNTFNKNKGDMSITFMTGGEYYPEVRNVEIINNRFNLDRVTFRCIQFPDHELFPESIHLNGNLQYSRSLGNKILNLKNKKKLSRDTRKDNTVVYTFDF